MADTDMNVTELLKGILSHSNELRGKSEECYLQSLREHPEYTIMKLIGNLSNQHREVCCLSAVLLKNIFSPLSSEQYFEHLNEQDKEIIKANLLNKSLRESDQTLRKLLCELVANLAIRIFNFNVNQWTELSPGIYNSLKCSISISVIEILGKILPYTADHALQHVELLYRAISQYLRSTDLNIRKMSVLLLHSLLSIVDEETEQALSQLGPALLDCVTLAFDSSTDEGNSILQLIIDIVGDCEYFLFPYYNECVFLCDFICNNTASEYETKYKILELCVKLIEKGHSLANKKETIRNIITRIFMIMVSVDTDDMNIDKEDEIVKLPYIDCIYDGVELLGRLLYSDEDRIIANDILTLVQDTISNNDWRFPYAALLTLSEIVGILIDTPELRSLFNNALIYGQSSHLILRASVYILLSALSKEHAELIRIQQLKIVTLLVNGLEDTDPIVMFYCSQSIQSIVHAIPSQILFQYSGILSIKLLANLQECKIVPIINETSKAIASLYITNGDNLHEYYDQVVGVIIGILHRYQGDIYKYLRGTLIQTTIIISKTVGIAKFLPYSSRTVYYLTSLQNSELNSGTISETVFKCWKGLADVLESPSLLHEPIPVFLKLISTQQVTDRTLISALKTLSFIIKKLQGDYSKYIDNSIHILLPLISYTFNWTIRAQSSLILSYLVISCRKSCQAHSLENSIEMSKLLLPKLLAAIQEEYIVNCALLQLQSFSYILTAPGQAFLSPESLQCIFSKISELYSKFNSKLSSQFTDQHSQELAFSELRRFLDVFALAVSSLFSSHPQLAHASLGIVFSRFISSEHSLAHYQVFSLRILKSVVSSLSPHLTAPELSTTLDCLLSFSLSRAERSRELALDCLNTFITQSRPCVFKPYSSLILAVLLQSVSILPEDSSGARDNGILAIGNMLKHQSVAIDIYSVLSNWVNLLPLIQDKQLEVQMQHLLAELSATYH